MAEPSSNGSSRISVSEDTLKRVLAEFKLELFTELRGYATTSVTNALDIRVGMVEREGSIGTRDELRDHEGRIRVLEALKWELRGMVVLIGLAVTLLSVFSPWH